MIDHDLLLLFLPLALLLVITPGADTMSVLTLSLRKGRAAGLRSIAGHATSSVVHIAAAALGLSAIVVTSAAAFDTIKFVGALYLLYLGFLSLSKRDGAFNPAPVTNGRGDFWQGFITHIANPKVAAFYLTVIPHFMNPKLGHLAAQAISLGAVHIALAMVWLCGLSFAAGRARMLLTGSERFWSWQRRITGLTFVAFGFKMALARRGS